MDVFFPMAGQGARFGHRFKPFLRIGDEAFIEAAIRPFLRFAEDIDRLVFVYLESQERDFGVSGQLPAYVGGLPFEIVRLTTPTRGPAETIARAVSKLEARGRAFVCDCDHSIDVGPLFELFRSDTECDVLLPVWPLEGESVSAWSVAMVDGDNVRALAEKQVPASKRGSPMGVIGCYGFREIESIAHHAEAIAATNFSDVIGRMLVGGALVRAARIESASFFGDPERLAKATGVQ